MTYHYRYLRKDGKPLKNCPECNRDLTVDGGVEIALCVAGHVFYVNTTLDGDGNLIDTEDNAVAHGHHSGTCCHFCGELLIDIDGVQELVDETDTGPSAI